MDNTNVTIPEGVARGMWRWIDDLVGRSYQVPPEAVDGVKAWMTDQATGNLPEGELRLSLDVLDAFLAFRLALRAATERADASGVSVHTATTVGDILGALGKMGAFDGIGGKP